MFKRNKLNKRSSRKYFAKGSKKFNRKNRPSRSRNQRGGARL